MPYRILPASSTRDMVVWTLKAQQVKVEEEIKTIKTEPITNHALISGLGWLLGSTMGLGMGFLVFRGLKSIIIAKPKTYEFIILFPWRTILMSLLLPALYPLIFLIIFGVGIQTGIASTGTAIFLASIAFVISNLLESWRPTSLIAKFIATSRILATLSVAFVFVIGVFGGGGMGYTTVMEFRLFNFELVYRYYGSMIILMLIPDTVPGILQHHFIKHSLTEQ